MASTFSIPASELVHTAVLEAALAKLNVNIPFEDVMKAIRKEEEARRIKPDEPELVIPPELAGGVHFDYVATFDPNPHMPDERQKESYRRLLEQFDKAFPSGRVTGPIGFGSSLLNSSPS